MDLIWDLQSLKIVRKSVPLKQAFQGIKGTLGHKVAHAVAL